MERGRGLFIFASLVFGMGTSVAGPGASVRPTRLSYEMQARADDCGVYRSVGSRARAQEKRARGLIATAIQSLENKRQALDDCGKRYSNLDEQVLAEVCSGPYQDWLDSGVELALVEEQARDLKLQMEQLAGLLDENCSHLPPGVILSTWRGRWGPPREVERDETAEQRE
ncbi:MAG: hypothetical protein HYZ71_16015 [Deltaproteobacteria bacterium]|nr:hypothetical protein [Deltaproteobacteria bacterium]